MCALRRQSIISEPPLLVSSSEKQVRPGRLQFGAVRTAYANLQSPPTGERPWQDFKQNGAAIEQSEEATVLTVADELLGTRYCEPTRMNRKQRWNTVEKSTLQYCVQGTFNCEDGDERGEPDARW
eukprot:scaffold82531_cov56-Phaeocystis_antarctica.AAC.1